MLYLLTTIPVPLAERSVQEKILISWLYVLCTRISRKCCGKSVICNTNYFLVESFCPHGKVFEMTSQQRNSQVMNVTPEGAIRDASGRIIAPPQTNDSYERPDGPWNQNGGQR